MYVRVQLSDIIRYTCIYNNLVAHTEHVNTEYSKYVPCYLPRLFNIMIEK